MGSTQIDTDVVVVGAGLAGLTAGAVAARDGARVVVLDAHRPGGRAAVTAVDSPAGPVLFNGGPHALYRGGAGLRVLRGLGVEPRGRRAPTAGSRALVGDRLEPLPVGPASMVRTRLVPNRAKPRLARTLVEVQRGRVEPGRPDRSAADWVRDVAGSAAGARLLTGLLRVATYSSDLDRLSADAASEQLVRAAGSGVLYLDGGWGQLVDGVASAGRAAGMDLRVGTPVRSVTAGPAGVEVVAGDHDSGERVLRARAVVVAAGSPAAAAGVLGLADPWAGMLGPEATAACLELAVRRPPAVRFVMGVDEPLYLSVHAPPADLAPPGVQVVHVARYGVRSSAEDRAQLRDLARRAGIGDDDVVAQRFLHRMVVSPGQPTPSAGGLAGRPRIEVPGLPGAFVAGDWVGAEGLLADASFASGALAGTRAAAHAARTPTGSTVERAR